MLPFKTTQLFQVPMWHSYSLPPTVLFVKIADYLNGMFVAALGSALEAFDGAQEGTLAGFIRGFCRLRWLLGGRSGSHRWYCRRKRGYWGSNADLASSELEATVLALHLITVVLALIVDFSALTDASAG